MKTRPKSKRGGKNLKENKTIFHKIDSVLFKFLKYLSYISGVALVMVAVICTADAVSTNLFNRSITNSTDFVTYLNIPVVFCAIAFVQVERGHTHIDLLIDKFPKIVQKVIMFLSYLLGGVVSSIIAWRSFVLMQDKLETMAKAASSRTSFVVWPFAVIVAVGFALLAIAMFWSAIREWAIPEEERAGYFAPPPPVVYEDEEEGGAE